ncbi:MAG: thiol-disulfide oxidoreductase DCC family protein [Bacteroidetes bacterium]|nr:thiol-disulfide oxidoreductase DCC family protein [Bacteroidota bacterium]
MRDDEPIVFFDGVCNFCNYWVIFAIRRDRKKQLKFAPLQGETAKRILPEYSINFTSLSSVILIEKGRVWKQSSAAIRICKHLNGGWKFFYSLIIVPRFIRDFFYNILARNRYKWFGRKEECMVPTPELIDRFIH